MELQVSDIIAQKIRPEGLNKYKEIDKILHHHGLWIISELSLSIGTITTFWQDILILINPRTLLVGNTISQISEKILRSMLKAVTYAYIQK